MACGILPEAMFYFDFASYILSWTLKGTRLHKNHFCNRHQLPISHERHVDELTEQGPRSSERCEGQTHRSRHWQDTLGEQLERGLSEGALTQMAAKHQAGWAVALRFQTGNSSWKRESWVRQAGRWEKARKPLFKIFHYWKSTGEGEGFEWGGDSSVLVWLLSRPFSCCPANFPPNWGMGLLVLAGHNQPSANLPPKEFTLLSLLRSSNSSNVKLQRQLLYICQLTSWCSRTPTYWSP